MSQKFFLKTFGCAQNIADSERIVSSFISKGWIQTKNISDADVVVINTCMVRESAENRVYGLINNIQKNKKKSQNKNLEVIKPKIILTGCMIGMAVRDKTGSFFKILKKRMPQVNQFIPIEEIISNYSPIRQDNLHALVPITNGCNNFCSYCVVPYTRGREVSRPYEEIIKECQKLAEIGYRKITLLGMNVNSYGADLILGSKNANSKSYHSKYFSHYRAAIKKNHKKLIKGYRLSNKKIIYPVLVKHLGRLRIPTLFPYLLEDICKIKKIELIDFMSSNPWDFSDELIEVIARNPKISRSIHLPVQSGSNSVLKRMNRWYTRNEYLKLVANLKLKIRNLKLSTDIIVGFCGETEKEFQETVDLCQKVGFCKAYISKYSDRPMTFAHKKLKDDVSYKEKLRRWKILEQLINKPNFKK